MGRSSHVGGVSDADCVTTSSQSWPGSDPSGSETPPTKQESYWVSGAGREGSYKKIFGGKILCEIAPGRDGVVRGELSHAFNLLAPSPWRGGLGRGEEPWYQPLSPLPNPPPQGEGTS
ncbi:hypothetical protein PLANPX_6060 [Lacipirellula parvula]|uniref:Uncharacterized protein n=1 Tax=Lacipirellula parvula TaxID=2650471 RepID=A0A5K7XIY1_9BACT|nr:hypothetical protein PLANPX_6060 [Lacipirellula parvula]